MKIGLVLSGGAVRGATHIGVLKALKEFGIEINILSGVSAGSIIAVFYAAGYSPKEMEDILLKTDIKKYLKLKFPKQAFFSLEKLDILLERYIGRIDLSELKIKTYITVIDYTIGEVKYIDKGDLIQYIKASCSLPVVFEPTYIDGKPYIDGGIMDNLPIEPLIKEKCELKICSEVNPFPEFSPNPNIFKLAVRSLFLAIRSNTENNKKYCDIFLQPPQLVEIGLFSIKDLKKAIDIGYNYTKKFLEENLKK
ncbi:MAG: Patatin [Persephonella sp.]|nr:MAG: Patatin [Persephonella sp.]RUM60877.1 MAG: Patatin [Persephonella sp.]